MRTIQLGVANFAPYIHGLEFSPDSRKLAVLVGDSETRCLMVHWWDLQRNVEHSQEHGGGHDTLDDWPDPALSPDHKLIACLGHEAHSESDYLLLTARTGKRRGQRMLFLGDAEAAYAAFRFSPDGKWLAAAMYTSGAPGIYRWDVAAVLQQPPARSSGWRPDQCLEPLPDLVMEYVEDVTALAFSPEGRILAAGTMERSVLRWEFATGQPLPPLLCKGRGRVRVARLAFSPDGRTLAAAAGPVVTLFDTDTDTIRAALTGHSQTVRDLAFHPGGRMLATVCGDDSIRLWEVATGKERDRFEGRIGDLSAVAFAPDGCTGAAGGEHGRILQWDVDL
jgi:WD40 repeat protein